MSLTLGVVCVYQQQANACNILDNKAAQVLHIKVSCSMLDSVKTKEANEFLMSNEQLTCIYEAAVESQSYSPESFSLPVGENE